MTDKKESPGKQPDPDQKRMDEVLKNLLNTPPQPHEKKKKKWRRSICLIVPYMIVLLIHLQNVIVGLKLAVNPFV